MPSSTTAGRPVARVAQIRNSCNACAAAKVGCTKEKPACNRCVKRKETCVYAVARRAGRPTHAPQKPPATDDHRISLPTPTSPVSMMRCPRVTPDDQTAMKGIDIASPGFTQSLLEQYMLDEAFRPSTSASTSMLEDPEFGASAPALQDLLDSLSVPSLDSSDDILRFHNNGGIGVVPDGEPMGDGLANHHHHHHRWLHSPNTRLPTPSEVPKLSSSYWKPFGGSPETIQSSEAVIAGEFSELARSTLLSEVPQATCGCLAKVSTCLNELTPSSCTPGNPYSGAAKIPSPQATMTRNESVLKEINEVLRCACSHESNILLILWMTVLKILGWYAAVAWSVSRGETSSPSDCADSSATDLQKWPDSALREAYDDGAAMKEGRLLCQSVLSKLASVQTIVSTLSQRLVISEGGREQMRSPTDMDQIVQELLYANHLLGPSSRRSLAPDLEARLRCRIRDVSQGIVRKLQEW